MRRILAAALIALAPAGCAGGVDWERPWLERQYVRDPEGVLDAPGPDALERDSKLPPDAEYTGYHSGEIQRWISRSDATKAVYVARPERVERRPRARRHIFCD